MKRLSSALLVCSFLILTSLTLSLEILSPTKKYTNNQKVLGAVDDHNTGVIPSSYRGIGNPSDLYILPNGQLWYIDDLNNRLVRINTNGTVDRTVRTLGKTEEVPGQVYGSPIAMTVDNEGNVYTTEWGWTYLVNRVVKYDSNGGVLAKWGTLGSGDGQFSKPIGITYDAFSNSILVVDANNNRVQKFDKMGNFIDSFGTTGTGDGQFSGPLGITTDASGNIYVTDQGIRLQVFGPDYTFLRSVTNASDPNLNFNALKDIAVLDDGTIVLTSQNSEHVVMLHNDGSFYKNIWGFQHPSFVAKYVTNDNTHTNYFYVTDYTLDSIQKFTATGDAFPTTYYSDSGISNGKITAPNDLDYDSAGNLYVLHYGGHAPQIDKYTNDGNWLGTIVSPSTLALWVPSYTLKIHNDKIYVPGHCGVFVLNLDGTQHSHFGGCGTGDGDVNETRGIVFDSSENIYVADLFNRRIEKYDSNGNYIRQWGGEGSGPGQFVYPGYMVIYNNLIYVGDGYNHRIQKFTFDGEYRGEWAVPDVGYMALDSQNHLYITVSESQVNMYDIQTETLLKQIGSTGSGIDQFYGCSGLDINPVTDTLSVADNYNHRVVTFGTGSRIEHLTPSADVLRANDQYSLVNRFVNPSGQGVDNMNANMFFGDYIVSDFTVDLTASRDWTTVDATSLPGESKTVLTNLNTTAAPGISGTHTLYIVKQYGQTSVHICPDATNILDITETCSNNTELIEGQAPNLSTVTIDGVDYWKITGLTGTGGYSLPIGLIAPTPSPSQSPVPSVSPSPSPEVTVTTSPTVTTTATPSITASVTPTVSVSPTPTTTVTTTPSITITVTPTPTTTGTVPSVTLPAGDGTDTNCPVFSTFTVSSPMIKPNNTVKFTWNATHASSVRLILNNITYPAQSELSMVLDKTTTFVFVATNGSCQDQKISTVTVVDTYPWETALAVGAGAVAVEAGVALLQPATLGNAWLALGTFFDRKKKRAWGFVYDSKTKKPVSRAIIRLIDNKTNEVLQTAVSEATGVYKLAPRIGSFTLSVTHPLYTFPSKVITNEQDSGYVGVYHGETITVKDENHEMLLSIPLDPITLTDTQRSSIQFKNIIDDFVSLTSTVILFAGFSYTLYATLLYPLTWNFLTLSLYIVAIALKLVLSSILTKKQGVVVNTAGQPVAGLELGLFDDDFKNMVYRTFSNADGSYNFAVPNKSYKLRILDAHYALFRHGEAVTEQEIAELSSKEPVRLITDTVIVKEK